jgi:hypothetical protein
MTALTEQETGWINEVTGRLRLIQADTAQLDAAKRSEFLQEEVERSFKNVAPANRQRLLEALLARFPVAGKTTGSVSPAVASAPASVPPPLSPAALLDKFLAALPALPENERSELTKRLLASGLTPAPTAAAGPLNLSEETQRALGLAPGQSASPERLAQLAVLLLDALSRLDQTGLKTAEVLSPRSSLLKRNESVRRAAGRFLTGETDSVETPLREVAGLLGALLAGALGGGRVFGQQYLERFSPTAIEDVVTAEGGGGMFGPSKKERCWDRYVDLARDFATPDLVDRRVKECLASVAQRTLEKGNLGR